MTVLEYVRTSIYTLDGSPNKARRIARYEKDKEVLEDALKPGELLLDPRNYPSLGAWTGDCRAEDQEPSKKVCYHLSEIGKHSGLKWPENYFLLRRIRASAVDISKDEDLFGDDRIWWFKPGEWD